MDGLGVQQAAGEHAPAAKVIVVTADPSVETCRTALQNGAFDYIEKPLDLDELRAVVSRAAQVTAQRRTVREMKRDLDERYGFDDIVAASPVMIRILETIRRVAAADLPVLLTSCGQSPGPERVLFFLKRLDLQHEFVEQATADNISDGSFKALIIVTGASLKGMGAAGISIEDELARTAALIEEARSQGMTVIGAHIEGMKRRAQGAAPGDNTDEQSIDAVGPSVDLLVVKKEGNTDGRFTTIANEKGIPMIEVEKTLDLMTEFEKLFKK